MLTELSQRNARYVNITGRRVIDIIDEVIYHLIMGYCEFRLFVLPVVYSSQAAGLLEIVPPLANFGRKQRLEILKPGRRMNFPDYRIPMSRDHSSTQLLSPPAWTEVLTVARYVCQYLNRG